MGKPDYIGHGVAVSFNSGQDTRKPVQLSNRGRSALESGNQYDADQIVAGSKEVRGGIRDNFNNWSNANSSGKDSETGGSNIKSSNKTIAHTITIDRGPEDQLFKMKRNLEEMIANSEALGDLDNVRVLRNKRQKVLQKIQEDAEKELERTGITF